MAVRDALALTPDQRDLRDTLRGFLADQLSSEALRAMVDTDAGYSADLHTRLGAELGLAGLTISEEFGGLGLSQAEAGVVHAELGRALYPGPYLASCLAAGLLGAGPPAAGGRESTGGREAAAHWLPRLADGSVTGTVAAMDQAGRWTPGPDSVRAEQAAGGAWRLSGRRWYVLAGHVAGLVVVPAALPAAEPAADPAAGGSGIGLFLVESGAAGFTATVQAGLDLTRRVSTVAFDATPAVLLSQGPDAADALARAEREFGLGTAAEAAGGIGWCLDAAVAYAKDRHQFGRAIGSYQAVAHACVDMLAAAQEISATARYAAVADAEGAADAPMAAQVAVLRAGQAYRAVTEAAVHVFGGIGFTWEHDAHLYYRRAWSAEALSGGPQAHRAALAGLAGL